MIETEYEAAAAYVAAHCVPAGELAARVGVSPARLAELDAAKVLPAPTYRVGRRSVISAIRALGEPEADAAGWYGVAVVDWLRRAATLLETTPPGWLKEAMADWLAQDLRAELQAQAADAAAFGWAEMFGADGACGLKAVRGYVDGEWRGWMLGGWAVCLRRFDGRHLAVKEIERRRIAALTGQGGKPLLEPGERLAVVDAMRRLDAVLLPFAPHERPHGTPGIFLDEPARRYGLPWTPPFGEAPTPPPCLAAASGT